VKRNPIVKRIALCLFIMMGFTIFLLGIKAPPGAEINQKLLPKIKEAKSKLQMGLNTWNAEYLKNARDIFLNVLVKEKRENVYLFYYVALCDYRLAAYYFISNNMKEAERHIEEGQKYLEKAIEADPSFGESYALYATLLGYEIALNQERAMALGFKTYEYSDDYSTRKNIHSIFGRSIFVGIYIPFF